MRTLMAPALAVLIAGSAVSAQTFETVVLSDEIAPGLGVPFGPISAPALNNNGAIAFDAELTGIWLREPKDGDFTPIALEDAPSPAGGTFDRFDPPVINDAGEVAFEGVALGPIVNGVWAYRGGTLALVAQKDEPAPGGVWYSTFLDVELCNDGWLWVFCAISDGFIGGSPEGLFAFDGVSDTLVFKTTPNPTTEVVSFSAPSSYNDSGQAIFAANYSSGNPNNNRALIVSWASGGSAVVARAGNIAPDTGGAIYGRSLHQGALNDLGHYTFAANLQTFGDDAVGEDEDEGLWYDSGFGPALFLREGDAAPGVPRGGTFESFSAGSVNNSGLILFSATLRRENGVTTDNDSGYWLASTPEDARLLVRDGDRIGGTGFEIEDLRGAWRNENGLGLLKAEVRRDDNSMTEAFFTFDVSGGPFGLLLQLGDVIEVAPGDSREVQAVSAITLNESDVLAMTMSFTDGTTGIFTTTITSP